MICYPITLTEDDNGTILATCVDFPELTTFGEDRMDALSRAQDALLEAIEARIIDGAVIPAPNSNGKTCVQLPMLAGLKVGIHIIMRNENIRKIDLARLLHFHRPQIDRLLDLNHATPVNSLEQAFDALGKKIIVQVTDAPENRI